jgi:hypothetical protein
MPEAPVLIFEGTTQARSAAMVPGVISLGDQRWLATGWLFCWVVGFLAMNVEQQRLAADIDHVRADDSRLLELGKFGPEAVREMRELLRDRLVAVAEERFPPTMRGRSTALALLRELAGLASESPVDGRSVAGSARTFRAESRAIHPGRTVSASF